MDSNLRFVKKLLVVTGPTATGKTKLGITLAKRFNGEIVSADSRQVYKGNDIETGKDIDKSKVKSQKSKIQFKNQNIRPNYYEFNEVKIWGVDLVETGYNFNVSEFVNYAMRVIEDIWVRGKLPIVVGGTGLYIKELIFPSETLHIPPNIELRSMNYELWELQNKLQKINKNRWEMMNDSDRKNPRRIIRAIETAIQKRLPRSLTLPRNDTLIVGLSAPREVIYKKIVERRADRPDLVEKEFKLAKKQMTYQKKMFRDFQDRKIECKWFDVEDSKFFDSVINFVERWYIMAYEEKKGETSDNKRKG